jgi:hypothetical protein
MIKKIAMPLGPQRVLNEKRQVDSTMKFEKDIFAAPETKIRTMKVVNKGHEIFNNGFTAKGIKGKH